MLRLFTLLSIADWCDKYHQSVVDHAKAAEQAQPGRPLAVALDTKGPEIRTGNTVGDADIPISEGTELNITTDEKYATASDDKNMLVHAIGNQV